MTDRAELLVRIEHAIARKAFAQAAAGVLAELERDHDIVPKGTWIRVQPDGAGVRVAWPAPPARADPGGEDGAMPRLAANAGASEA